MLRHAVEAVGMPRVPALVRKCMCDVFDIDLGSRRREGMHAPAGERPSPSIATLSYGETRTE
jgi:hypothetical protein